jgi:hypothetical protein
VTVYEQDNFWTKGYDDVGTRILFRGPCDPIYIGSTDINNSKQQETSGTALPAKHKGIFSVRPNSEQSD